MRQLTISQALREALYEEMSRDESVFVIGEDIGHYGGMFEVTQGFLKEFGPTRVIDTPISEAAIAGAAIGAALAGMRPVAEIMYCDWMTLAMDQIVNYGAMLTYAYGGQVKIPVVIRTTVGSWTVGAQHAKSLEAWLFHVPGLKIVMPCTPYDAKGLLKSAIRDDNPVICVEHKMIYRETGWVPEEEYFVPIGVADVKREGRDVTVIATGKMVLEALQAAGDLEKEGLSVEVVDPRTLSPLDTETLVASAKKTGRVLVVHEAWRQGGVGAEIAAVLSEAAFGSLRQPVRRLAALDVPPPFSPALEPVVKPDAAKIVAAIRSMMV